jgi:hypothetical protein
MVKRLESPEVSAQWDSFTGCFSQKACTDDDYFNLILAVSIDQQEVVPHATLIANLITVNRYWGTEQLVDFSKALAAAYDQVEALQVKTVRNKWESIIKCAGTCPEYHALFYDLIRLIVQVE